MQQGHSDLPFLFLKAGDKPLECKVPSLYQEERNILSPEMGNQEKEKSVQTDLVKLAFVFLVTFP